MLSYRADIQGLRALAVILVMLDHAAVGPFEGGFVGVDVFFVISGYLITALLLREAERSTGDGARFSLKEFYARRARRILPAAMLVIIATLVLSAIYLDGASALLVGEQAVWATFFAANVKFATDSVDYFAADEPLSPLQHYWSLSVEEQFYLVWPVLLLGSLALLAKRMRSVRHAAAVVLVWIIGASLTWSIIATATSPLTAYFSTPARAWQLGMGALLAVVAPTIAKRAGVHRRVRIALAVGSWAGAVAVFVAAMSFSSDTAFPGYAALLPVLGTVFLLAGGLPEQPAKWGPQGLLSLKPFTHLGDWSYSMYLWHWPLLIIGAAQYGEISGWSGALVLVIATALSALTYKFVETPFRRAPLLTRHAWGRRYSLGLYPAMIAIVIPVVLISDNSIRGQTVGTGDAITVSDIQADPNALEQEFSRNAYNALVQASVIAARQGNEIPANLKPDPFEIKDSVPDLGDCDYFAIETEDLELCPRGDIEGDRAMVLIGDSHARQWIPALEQIASERGFVAYYLVRQGCPAVDRTPWRGDGAGPNFDCADFQDWAAERVSAIEPEVVLLATDANENGFSDGSEEPVTDDDEIVTLVEEGMVAQIARIAPHTDRTVIIGDPPIRTISPPNCLTRTDEKPTLAGCMGPPQERSLRMLGATRRAARTTGVDFIETKPWFCWRDQCPTVVGDLVTHRDVEHLTIEYAEYLAPALDDKLDLG